MRSPACLGSKQAIFPYHPTVPCCFSSVWLCRRRGRFLSGGCVAALCTCDACRLDCRRSKFDWTVGPILTRLGSQPAGLDRSSAVPWAVKCPIGMCSALQWVVRQWYDRTSTWPLQYMVRVLVTILLVHKKISFLLLKYETDTVYVNLLFRGLYDWMNNTDQMWQLYSLLSRQVFFPWEKPAFFFERREKARMFRGLV